MIPVIDGTLTIPKDVAWIKQKTVRNCIGVKHVNIGDSVCGIASDAFANFSTLESVNISDSVAWIEPGAFRGCTNLKSINLPETLQVIENAVFYCTSIEEIEIPETVSIISANAFYGCEKLKSVKIPDSVTSIEPYAFAYCKSMKSLELPTSISKIENAAFGGCEGLTTIDIPVSVTSIAPEAFCACTNLESVTIQSGIKSVGAAAFAKCPSLKSVHVAKPKPLKLKGNEFEGSQSDCTLYVPKGSKELYSSAPVWKDFKAIEEYTPKKVEKPDKDIVAQGKCGKDVRWTLYKSGVIFIYGSGPTYNFQLYNGYETSAPWKWYVDMISQVSIGKGVTKIGNYAFANCSYLFFVNCANDDILISDCAFEGCSRLY